MKNEYESVVNIETISFLNNQKNFEKNKVSKYTGSHRWGITDKLVDLCVGNFCLPNALPGFISTHVFQFAFKPQFTKQIFNHWQNLSRNVKVN